MNVSDAVALVLAERERQATLHAEGRIPGRCDDSHITDVQRLAALVEEVGEVAECLIDEGDLRGELVQVAAVALGWIMWEPS